MKKLIYLVIPLIAFSQETNLILEKLINFKSIKTNLDLSYDPFKTAGKSTSFGSQFLDKDASDILKAILNDKAFINESWYSVGDILGGFRIVKITKDTVYLAKGNEYKNLKLTEFKQYVSVKEK